MHTNTADVPQVNFTLHKLTLIEKIRLKREAREEYRRHMRWMKAQVQQAKAQMKQAQQAKAQVKQSDERARQATARADQAVAERDQETARANQAEAERDRLLRLLQAHNISVEET